MFSVTPAMAATTPVLGAVPPLSSSTTRSIGQADTSVSDFVANTNAGGATPVTSGTGNLIRTAVGFSGTIVSSADPLLNALSSNGGPTQTMSIPSGSPARNAGNNSAIQAA